MMKFRSEFSLSKLPRPIRYEDRLLALGSCFAQTISSRLKEAKFAITINPLGVMFNPISLAHTVERLFENRPIGSEELLRDEVRDLWFHYEMHGSLSSSEREGTIEQMNRAIEQGHRALKEASVVIITFGTAFVYRLRQSGRIVANCHQQPRALFQRELLDVKQITNAWRSLLEHELRDKEVIFTLSPVRHLSDGAEENSLSKALLRVALGELTKEYPQCHYFAAWELMMDDLRDYRFYADDLLHPAPLAIDYLWERFREVALAPECGALSERIARLQRALNHRPLHPESEAFRRFLREQASEIIRLEELLGPRFEEEKAILSSSFQ